MHCQTRNDVKHLITRKDEQITLLILRIPIIPAVLWQWLNEFQDVRGQMEMRSFIRKATNRNACCRIDNFGIDAGKFEYQTTSMFRTFHWQWSQSVEGVRKKKNKHDFR